MVGRAHGVQEGDECLQSRGSVAGMEGRAEVLVVVVVGVASDVEELVFAEVEGSEDVVVVRLASIVVVSLVEADEAPLSAGPIELCAAGSMWEKVKSSGKGRVHFNIPSEHGLRYTVDQGEKIKRATG